MIISFKQKKRKFEPRIKLNHNILVFETEAIIIYLLTATP